MATKSLIFKEIEITDTDGTGGATFDKHVVDSAEVTLEPVESTIEDGQTLTDAYDATFAVGLYDSSVLADARVYNDASADPVKANIIFKGVSGSSDLKLESVIINGSRDFSGNRTQAMLRGSKRAVTLDNSVDVSDAT